MLYRSVLLFCLVLSVLSSQTMDEKVIEFERKKLDYSNKRLTINTINVIHKQPLSLKGWYGFVLDINATIGERTIRAKDILFSDGKLITTDFIDLKSGNSIKESIAPKLSAVFHNRDHLIAGTHRAKHKIVLFSDPLCPKCQKLFPDLIEYVKKNAGSMALYYYHFPLLKHRFASKAVTKAMVVASKNNRKNIYERVYRADFQSYFDFNEIDEKKVLDVFNERLKTNITLEQINEKWVEDHILQDMFMAEELLINSTPTVYINGDKDLTYTKYKTLKK